MDARELSNLESSLIEYKQKALLLEKKRKKWVGIISQLNIHEQEEMKEFKEMEIKLKQKYDYIKQIEKETINLKEELRDINAEESEISKFIDHIELKLLSAPEEPKNESTEIPVTQLEQQEFIEQDLETDQQQMVA